MALQFDNHDNEILKTRIELWNERTGPRVGDFVQVGDNLLRFTHDWGDDIQTTLPKMEGSFYFGKGYMSYSGSLDPAILKSRLTDTGKIQDGSAWFFHHDSSGAHRGVYFKVPCRIYSYA